MSSVKIQNLTIKNPVGAMKLPTGGFGDYAVTVNSLANWIMTERDVATNTKLNLHIDNTSNPHNVTKSQVGLGNADNTSDTDKPVSTAQQSALDSLQNSLQTNINLKANSSDVYTKTQTYTKTEVNDALNLKANSTDVYTKSQINTSLALKLDATANAVSSSKWNTARTISTTGDATYSVSLDGSSNVSGVLTLTDTGVTSGTYTKVTVDSKGRVTTGSTLSATDIPTLNQNTTGNSATSTKWATPRTISLVGDVTGSVSVDGSIDVSVVTSVQNTLGVGQTYQNVTSSRVSGTTYTNNTGKPIFVSLSIQDGVTQTPLTITVSGMIVVDVLDFGAGTYPMSFIVPPNSTYVVNTNENTIRRWVELR